MNKPLILTNEKIIYAVDYLLQTSNVSQSIFQSISLAIQKKDISALEYMLSIEYSLDFEHHFEIIYNIMSLNDFNLFKKAYFFQHFKKDSDTLNKILAYAISVTNTDILSFLLEQGADGSLNNEIFLNNAVFSGNLVFVQFMVNHYHIDFKYSNGKPLSTALLKKDFDMIEYLISHGARLTGYNEINLKVISAEVFKYAQQIEEKVVQYEKMNTELPYNQVAPQFKM